MAVHHNPFQKPGKVVYLSIMMNMVIFGYQFGELSKIFSSVEFAFDVYRQSLAVFMETVDRAVQSMNTIDEVTAQYTSIHDDFRSLALRIPHLWEQNELVVRELCCPSSVNFVYAIHQNACISPQWEFETLNKQCEMTNKCTSYDSIEQVVVHLARDWGSSGKELRQALYRDGIITSLQNTLSAGTDGQHLHVLVPGGGLGRLAVELAMKGHIVEINECSGAMISVFRSIVDDMIPRGRIRDFYPYLNFPLVDDWDFDQRFQPQKTPWHEDSPGMREYLTGMDEGKSLLSVQYGEFVQVYGNDCHRDRFDAVVTCFFIDTARAVQEIAVIVSRILRPGGVWINSGPLHYHHKNAVPYSHRQVLQIISVSGFVNVSERRVSISYCGDDVTTMKPEMYQVPLSVFRYEPQIHAQYEVSDVVRSHLDVKNTLTINYKLK